MERLHRCFVAGEWVAGDGEQVENLNPYDQTLLSEFNAASPEQVRRAASALVDGREHARGLSQKDRYDLLLAIAVALEGRRDEFIQTTVAETGFTVSDVAGEVGRAQETLSLCAAAAREYAGEVIPFDGSAKGRGRWGMSVRKPLGVVAAITPFNSPINTVLHKLGPALAAGNAILLKPSLHTPATSGLLVETMLDAGVPHEIVALLHGAGATVGQWVLENPGPDFYTFTGSTEVGRKVRSSVGLRPSQLEMGSIAATIVCDDADVAFASRKVSAGSFRKSGQICTSVQRVLVHESVLEEFLDGLVEATREMTLGDPTSPQSTNGSLISQEAAGRVASWIDDTVDAGARLVDGGIRTGNAISPAILTGVPPTSPIGCNEVFGPVLSVESFRDFDQALTSVNASPYGLAAGVFTQRLDRAFTAARVLDVGGLHINETSNGRIDAMPYTGAKISGLGTEGPRYAMREMSQECVVSWPA